METESTEALVERYWRMDAQYRALGERLRATLGRRGGGAGAEPQRIELFRQLQEFQANIEVVQQELRRRTGPRANV